MKSKTKSNSAVEVTQSDREWLARQFESLTTSLPPEPTRRKRAAKKAKSK